MPSSIAHSFQSRPKTRSGPIRCTVTASSLSGGMRIDKGKLFAMTQPRAYQRLKPSADLWFIEAAQSPEALLAHLVALTDAVDNLEILIGTGTFDSEKHRSLS